MAERAGHPGDWAAGGRGWIAGAAIGYLAFVIYGSLVPLDFAPQPFEAAWRRFAAIPYLDLGIRSRADWVANILLFVPLAFLWTGALWPGRRGARAVAASLAVFAACVALSAGVEFMQIFFPPRTVSQNDILAETIGAAIGVLAWWWRGPWLWRTLRSWAGGGRDVPLAERFLWVYLAVLFGYSLLPLDLTLSPVEVYHKWRAGRVVLAPFSFGFSSPAEMAYGLATDALIWLPAGFLWTVSGRMRPVRAALWTVAAAALLEFLQLFVYSRISDVTDVITASAGGASGAALALAVRPAAASGPGARPALLRGRPALVLAVFAAWLAALAAIFWYPWTFDPTPARVRAALDGFWLLPFYRYYYGTEFRAVTEVLHKFLFFAPLGAALAFAWGPTRDRRLRRAAAWFSAGLAALAALFIEIGQALVPGKAPDSTDLVIEVLGALAGYWAMGRVLGRRITTETRAAPPPDNAPRPERPPLLAPAVARWAKRAVLLALGVVALAVGVNAVVALPGAPYNLRELFVADGPVPPSVWFALWLLWTGASAAVIGRVVARIEFAFVTIPLLAVASAAVSYGLLSAGVTPESIADIVGTPIVSRLPASSAFWEGVRQALLARAPSATTIDRAETLVRYVALISPLGIALVVFNASAERLALYGRAERVRFFLAYALIYLVLMAPWLYLAKLVIVDFAATDNLTELIAPPRFGFLGGEVFLFLLIVLIALNATALARASLAGARAFGLAVAATMAAIPLGWLLFNAGLVSALTKYGVTFSGVDFLLGPDRETKLSAGVLFLRWALAYGAGVGVLAYGQRAVLPFGDAYTER